MTIQTSSPLRPVTRCAAAECRRGRCGAALGVDRAALDRLMPLNMLVANDGTILHAGPTLLKLCAATELVGASLFGLFDLRRPRDVVSVAQLAEHPEAPVRLSLRDWQRTTFKGQVAPLSCGKAILIDLSFGIAVVDAVRRHHLTSSDFATTDLAVEMLFLVEAQSAALEEAKRFGQRLHSARIAAEEEAATDRLTGVRNRRALDHFLLRLVEQGAAFGLLHIDLDAFKVVNDTQGHIAGDRVLKATARRISESVRSEDMVARTGGDEFIVLISHMPDAASLGDLSERIMARIAAPISHDGQDLQVSASIGATASAFYAIPNLETMLADADAALYASKREGRARVTLARVGGQGPAPAEGPHAAPAPPEP